MKKSLFILIVLLVIKLAAAQQNITTEIYDSQNHSEIISISTETSWYENTWREFKTTFFPRSNSTAADIITVVVLLLLLTIVVFIIFFIVLGMHYCFNYIGTEVYKGTGKIVDKSHEGKSHTALITSGIVIPMVIKDDYSIFIQLDGSDFGNWVDVRKRFYKKINIGDDVSFSYKLGRLNGKLHVIDIF